MADDSVYTTEGTAVTTESVPSISNRQETAVSQTEAAGRQATRSLQAEDFHYPIFLANTSLFHC